jgi:hypothetical protein
LSRGRSAKKVSPGAMIGDDGEIADDPETAEGTLAIVDAD